jgi:ferrous iron transport protein B
MELPTYHRPYAINILRLTWDRTKGFLIRAGKIIIPVCIIIGTLNSISTEGKIIATGSHHSLLAEVSKKITPLFHPLGITDENWPATVGIVTGILAKETVIGTLNTLYSQQNNDEIDNQAWKNFDLLDSLKENLAQVQAGFQSMNLDMFFHPIAASTAESAMDKGSMGKMAVFFGSTSAAFAYMLFSLLYIPCISTIGALSREIGATWAFISTYWSISIAYSLAVLVYQTINYSTDPHTALFWISSILIYNGLLFILLRQWSKKPPAALNPHLTAA